MARASQHRGSFRTRRQTSFVQRVEPTGVLAVGNHQKFIEQISELVDSNERIRLLGGAQGRVQAAERLVLLKPDVVVIESNLDYELGGIDTAFAMRSISPSTAFVIISPSSDPAGLALVPRRLGLEWSYVLSDRGIDREDLVAAITSAAWSIPYVDSRIDRAWVDGMQRQLDSAVEQVLRTPRRSRKNPLDDWHGKVQRFRIEGDDEDGGA